MALTSRITLADAPTHEPEDFLGASLGVIFPDDVMNQHGDSDHGLIYQSPHLPAPLHLSLATPNCEEDRTLFSHYLWNASLLLAEFIEAGTLGLLPDQAPESPLGPPLADFNITDLTAIELGAGTALPSLLSALLGARRVVITDYPAPALLSNLRANAARNVRPTNSPRASVAGLQVDGHPWGNFSAPFAQQNRHSFDRVLVCDCLWMPWQHVNLQRSIEWFLRNTPEARCWVIAGFHTGREKMMQFFQVGPLGQLGLEVDRIWERDCDGVEREWAWDRGFEDPTHRKRWLTLAILKRKIGGLTGPG